MYICITYNAYINNNHNNNCVGSKENKLKKIITLLSL